MTPFKHVRWNKAVSYCRRALHLRCLLEPWLRQLCPLVSYFHELNYF